MKKNFKNKKNVALSLLGIGMVLALNACSASGQSATAATLAGAEAITKGEKTLITIQNDTVSINGNGATAEGKPSPSVKQELISLAESSVKGRSS